MTLDWLDRAFLDRPHRRPGGAAASLPHGVATAARQVALATPPADAVVTRLLEAVPSQWRNLADEIESARRAGRRVIAFTGGERGEGRSTIVAGVAAELRRRGRSVAVRDRAPLLLSPDDADEARAADLVLVDGGPWFSTGPVRRRAVERAALGCDAVVFVRRAEVPPCPAWADTAAALGLTVIGEAVTFDPSIAAG